jgi:hypothetical protein
MKFSIQDQVKIKKAARIWQPFLDLKIVIALLEK